VQVSPARTHQLDAIEWLDGTHEHGGRLSGRLGDDVQAVVHPVDKVHVGMSRRPEHRRVAGRAAEARVRRAVVGADVRLDLDDRAGSPSRGIVSNKPRAKQVPGSLERRSGEQRAVDDAQIGAPPTRRAARCRPG
jgi:hypothetical protein